MIIVLAELVWRLGFIVFLSTNSKALQNQKQLSYFV
ncbi:hypothetical protein PPHE_b6001 [Pseudoalteromonas phenolica O-BC30]|nr:hypothetical protein [Pseudoalteromonas phenolica O-BC30]